MRVIRFISLRTKLIILSVLSIVGPFAVVGSYTYTEYTDRVEARSRRYSEHLLSQVAIGIERYLKQIEDLSLAPLYDDRLIEILKHHTTTTESNVGVYGSSETVEIYRFLTSLRFDRNEVRNLGIYTKDRTRFSYSEYFTQDSWADPNLIWMKQARLAAGASRILPSEASITNSISMVRMLREPFTHIELGFTKVEFGSHNLEQAIFPTLTENLDYLLLIYNAQEELIYPTTISPMVFVGYKNRLRYNDKEYLASAYHSERSGLTMYGLVPYAEVLQEAHTLTSASVIIALISLILACILSIITANHIITPLRHLAGQMAYVRDGSFDARAKVETHDEIGELAQDFNLMAVEMQRLINEVYRINIKEQEAEIMLLQSQINPHFLYNTLETISMMAVERDRLDISNMVTKLGKMLRYSSNGTSRRVPLSSELAFVENYMAIQCLRLGERISMVLKVNEAYSDFLVPKLCLQPLVENVIDHGLNERPVKIEISVKAEDGDLIISVEDNGTGISLEAAVALELQLNLPDEAAVAHVQFGTIRRGIALRNIHHRIMLLHGSPYGISVSPGIIGGANFTIRVPLEKG